MGRCLVRLTFSLVGGLFLVGGLYLLYTVFIDTPDDVVATLGLSSAATNGVAAPPQPDAEIAAQQDEQIAAFGGDLDTQNIIDNNIVVDGQTDVRILRPVGVDGNNSPTTDINGQGGAAASYEQRLVELEWPESFRTGESGTVRLSYKALSAGSSGPEVTTNALRAQPIQVLNCYGDFEAFVTARMITPDSFKLETLDESTKRVEQGQEATWRWTLTPEKEGSFVMTLALQIEWRVRQGRSPLPGLCSSLADGTPNTIWGQTVQTEVNYVLGLITIEQASLAGTALAVIGTVSQVPLLMDILLIFFERRAGKTISNRGSKKRAKKRRR